ncbi:anthranilate 1,2-dioxygenase electron transfer component AntC [Zoogloea sp.]|uniref:anthranilate 1,2-dioxygenase electron transfer component AntC n=1 Tax=Zoogloea sp. TaxID=49181 RepID=UPI0014163921|nr:MAG: anthranilate 1,2-dioxygenase electron transfer component AntC [Zoogloea sp.]
MSHTLALSFADGKTLFLSARPGELLLDAARRQGVNLPMDCREGVCGTCRGRCESGRYRQDYVDEEALTPLELRERMVLACQTRVDSDAAFYFDFASAQCTAAGGEVRQAVVTGLEQVSDGTAVLHLAAEGAPLRFLPGQYARLRVPGTDQWRAYSFANLPNPENQLQFLIRLLPDGVMGHFLRETCRPGMPVELEAPFGSFYLRQVERPLVMVAGGTGLSAFLGMLEGMAGEGGCGQPVRLYYGVNREQDLCEIARLEACRAQIPDFDYRIVVSTPGAGWQGPAGFIPAHFDEGFLARGPFDMYLCGPPPMVDAVKAWLAPRALPEHRLYAEKFLHSHPRPQAQGAG